MSILCIFPPGEQNIESKQFAIGGREPPDAMSLRYADTSLPDLLGRLSLHYAYQASAMQTVPPLCSERASTYTAQLFSNLGFNV